MSMEKLQVHFREGLCAEVCVSKENVHLQSQLDSLHTEQQEQCKTLEATVQQMDTYQQDIQRLRQQMLSTESQLRQVSSPAYSPRDRDKAQAEQNAFKERIKAIQSKISARTERVKLLNQRGTPDITPLEQT